MMSRAFSKYFAAKDVLGGSISLSYRKSDKYGTSLGGICTLLTLVGIWAYLGLQIYELLEKPKFSSEREVTYVPLTPWTPVLNTTDY